MKDQPCRGPLTLAELPAATASRKALTGISTQLVTIYADAINELREVASICRARKDVFSEIGMRRQIAREGWWNDSRPAAVFARRGRYSTDFKTAKALGLTIPPSLLARADQVIE